MARIEDILARRTDLSTFLVHLTRDHGDGQSPRQHLEAIISGGRLAAGAPQGPAVASLRAAGHADTSQKVVCFTETPLEHAALLVGPIDARQVQLAPYGVAITKKQGRVRGVNPVWYVDITPGHNWLMTNVNALVVAAVIAGNLNADMLKLAPFIEQMGSGAAAGGGGYRKEFWWEREWRFVGDFALPEVVLGLCPEDEIAHFESLAEQNGRPMRFVDPRWSLERIVAVLADFNAADVGPF